MRITPGAQRFGHPLDAVRRAAPAEDFEDERLIRLERPSQPRRISLQGRLLAGNRGTPAAFQKQEGAHHDADHRDVVEGVSHERQRDSIEASASICSRYKSSVWAGRRERSGMMPFELVTT